MLQKNNRLQLKVINRLSMKINTNSLFHIEFPFVRCLENLSPGIKVIAVFLFLISVHMVIPASASAQEDRLEQIEKHAETLKDLIEKYQKAEIDLIKKEKVTIVNTQGAPQDCNVAIFYNNGKQARFRTSGGSFDGNFDHESELPTLPFSIRLSNCPCRVVSTAHSATWVELTEEIEKIKKVFEDEVRGKAQEQVKEFAEKGVEKVFEKLGYGASASGFLSGFGYGAALGQPIGDYITDGINQIITAAIGKNVQSAEHFDYAPLYPNTGHLSPRGRLGNLFGTSPQLINEWRVVASCGTRNIPPDSGLWNKVEEPVSTPSPPRIYNPNRDDEERRRIEQEEQEKERLEREEQRRWEKEQREREIEAQRQREEAQRRYEAEQRRIQELAREIERTCPICDPIRQHINTVTEQISEIELEIPGLQSAVASAEKEVADSEKERQRAQQKLDNFNNPDSWVESNGRRVTSSDLEVQRELSRENWERYKNGEQSADELMESWKNQNDTETHERAKERAEQRLNEDVENAEAAVRLANENLDQAKQNLNRARQESGRLNRLKDELQRLLDECLEKCKLQAEDIARGHITDYTELLDIDEIVIPEPEPIEQSGSDPEPEKDLKDTRDPDNEPNEEPEPEDAPETEEHIGREYEPLELTDRYRITEQVSIFKGFQWNRISVGAKLDFATRGAFEDAVCDQVGISGCSVDNLTPVFGLFSEMDLGMWDLTGRGFGIVTLSGGLSYTLSSVNFSQSYPNGVAGSSSFRVKGNTDISTLDLYGNLRRNFSPNSELPFKPSFSPFIKLGASQIWNSGRFETIYSTDTSLDKRSHNGLHFIGGVGMDIGFGDRFYTRFNTDYTAGGADANLRFGFGAGFKF